MARDKNLQERAARALCRLDGHPEDARLNGKPLWQDYLPEARAVLVAIHEPTDAMAKAGSHSSQWAAAYDTATEIADQAREVWRAMVSAALTDEDGTTD